MYVYVYSEKRLQLVFGTRHGSCYGLTSPACLAWPGVWWLTACHAIPCQGQVQESWCADAKPIKWQCT